MEGKKVHIADAKNKIRNWSLGFLPLLKRGDDNRRAYETKVRDSRVKITLHTRPHVKNGNYIITAATAATPTKDDDDDVDEFVANHCIHLCSPPATCLCGFVPFISC